MKERNYHCEAASMSVTAVWCSLCFLDNDIYKILDPSSHPGTKQSEGNIDFIAIPYAPPTVLHWSATL